MLLLKEKGFEVDKYSIDLKDAIKETGDFNVGVKLHKEVRAEFKVSVVAEEEE